MKKTLLISTMLIIFSSVAYTQNLSEKEKELFNVKNENYEKAIIEYKKLYNKDSKELNKFKHFQRWNYFFGQRTNDGANFDVKDILRQIKYEEAKEKSNKLLTSNINWNAFGPFNTPINDEGLGRINVIRFHPNNSRIIYVGSASGGAWVSKDNGSSWTILPTTDYLSLAISDIQISKSNPNVIYISTSDPNALNAVSGPIYSIGLLKSTNGGQTFNPTGKLYQLEEGIYLSSIAVHPEDENIVWVGTSRGVYKSTDGGEIFENKGPSEFIKDLELHPTNPDILYAASMNRSQENAKVYKSDDAGENWKIVQSYGSASRAELAVTPAMPNRVVSIVAQERPYSFHSYNLSDDSGETWNIQSNKDNALNVLGRNHGDYPSPNTSLPDQGWFDLCVALSPKNPNYTITGGIWLWSSGNAGKSFSEYVESYHVDQHYIQFTPTGDTAYIGNDGGLYRYIPIQNKIEFISKGMNITQYYKMSVNHQNLNMVIAGAQDNNTMLKRANGNWYTVKGGDGMDCHFDPKDPNYVYASSQNGNFSYSTNGGSNFRTSINSFITDEDGAWVTPFAVDPQKSGYVYAGYYNVWRSTNYGQSSSWEKISDFGTTSPLKILTIAKSNSNYIYASEGGTIRATSNGGQTWYNLTNPGGSVSDIEVHPTNPEKIYATINNFVRTNKVFEYDPESQKWENITGNLPNIPVNTIRFQENSPDRIFIGTDIGVYYTDYNSRYWERYGKGLPYTIVSDIDILEESNKIYISTYGRGVWSADLIDCDLPKIKVEALGELEFCFGDSVQLEVVDESFSDEELIWSNGETGRSIWVKDKGTYAVAAGFQGNCSPKSNYIEVNTLNVSDVSLKSSGGLEICENDSLRLTANFGFPNDSYIWDNGQNGLSRWVYEPGTYTIKVLNNNGCYSFDTITITLKDMPIPEIGIDGNILTTDTEGNLQWYFENEPIEGANSSTFLPESNGEVYVELRDGNCKSTSEPYFYDIGSVDSKDYFSIFPNPSNGYVNIRLTENVNSEVKIELVDLKGNSLSLNSDSIKRNKNNIELNLNEFNNGTYLVKVKLNNQIFTQKIILIK